MRFRLATGGQEGQQLGDGVGNFFRSLAMGPLYQAQAAEEAQNAEQKRRLMESQIGTHTADAAIKNNQLQTLQGRPDMLKLMSAARGGTSVPEFNAALSEIQNGAPMVGPPVMSPPIDGVGPSGRTQKMQSVIADLYAPAMATPANHLNWDQLAQARGHYQDQGVLDQAVQAANSGNYMNSSALSAVRGKKEFTPFKAVGSTGTALNEVTGVQPVSNPALAALFGNEGNALIGQRNAAAGASGASAGASKALAGLRGVQTGNAKIQGGILAEDYNAVQAGEDLPSKKRTAHGADSTNAKFINSIKAKLMADPAWSNAPDDEFTAELQRRVALMTGNPTDRPVAPAAGKAGGGKKPPDMAAAAAVKASFKAGKITMQQAKAQLQQLGFE